MNNNKDQWLHEGDCSKCRRANYCRQKCKQAQYYETMRTRRIIANAIHKTLFTSGGM